MISMLSPAFLGLIVVTVLLLGILEGAPRKLAFIGINGVFLVGMLLGVGGTLVTLCFLAIGYLLLLAIRNDARWGFVAGLPGFVMLFVYMQDYKFLRLLLPEDVLTSLLATVGLSFLFFKIVHVLIEAKSGTLGDVDLLTFVGYCTNFTTFAMGPLQRFQDYRDQWYSRNDDAPLEHYLDAVIRVLVGLVKAYVLAEWAKPYILWPNTGAADLPLGGILLGIYAFNIYLYLNFAGYTDVMIGVGTLFGVRPPENFDKPFLARDVSDFWQRQHRSLTLWLTDYIYTPSFKRLLSTPRLRTHPLLANHAALMLTMLVSGLWHGTSYGFLLFGLMHGAYLVIHRSWDALMSKSLGRKRARELRRRPWAHALAIFITFNAVSLAFVPFQLGGVEALEVFLRLLFELLGVLHV